MRISRVGLLRLEACIAGHFSTVQRGYMVCFVLDLNHIRRHAEKGPRFVRFGQSPRFRRKILQGVICLWSSFPPSQNYVPASS